MNLSKRTQPSIATHKQDFKDCKQILEDLLTPTLHKSPCKTSARQADRRFALWASSCRRLTPSAYLYSLRSDNEKRSGDLSLLPPRIAEIPRFCLRRKSLHLLSRFSPPEVIRLQLVMPLNPHRGSIIVFATVICK